VTAYGVERRTREIGVRMAIGASRRSVVHMVLREALRQVSAGLALGIPAAIAVGHLIASQLYAVTPWGGSTLFVAVLLLALATLIAAAVPARRAASVTPMNALRAD
jgi:ABC-type antimicrobial peptide transport system permease subunit